MPRYYVTDRTQQSGDHEVHREGCSFMPSDRTYLGVFNACEPAVAQARTIYPKSNGCYYCCRECHTT
jgi:hypothetical protein